MGVLDSAKWRITAILDHNAMITVASALYGVFDCKPLEFIWAKFPGQYTKANTVAIDDLRRCESRCSAPPSPSIR